MKTAGVLLCVVVMAVLEISLGCSHDDQCINTDCSNSDHGAYCHFGECHCHGDIECSNDGHCEYCGHNYSCDHGHCHGDNCTHTR